ncbi:hypothetical protein B7494_g789 [Chlorociboria aeruginascens]|nr:hypothetical protein B7494_g789 [Chlorociboria aeruginascens]
MATVHEFQASSALPPCNHSTLTHYESALMYKARIRQWGLKKNIRKRDAMSILHTIWLRAAMGKGPVPSRNEKEVNIARYMKRAKLTEYGLMDFSETVEIPRGVELRTPITVKHSTT